MGLADARQILCWVREFWNSWVWWVFSPYFLDILPPPPPFLEAVFVCGFFMLCLHVAFYLFYFFLSLLSFFPL